MHVCTYIITKSYTSYYVSSNACKGLIVKPLFHVLNAQMKSILQKSGFGFKLKIFTKTLINLINRQSSFWNVEHNGNVEGSACQENSAIPFVTSGTYLLSYLVRHNKSRSIWWILKIDNKKTSPIFSSPYLTLCCPRGVSLSYSFWTKETNSQIFWDSLWRQI